MTIRVTVQNTQITAMTGELIAEPSFKVYKETNGKDKITEQRLEVAEI